MSTEPAAPQSSVVVSVFLFEGSAPAGTDWARMSSREIPMTSVMAARRIRAAPSPPAGRLQAYAAGRESSERAGGSLVGRLPTGSDGRLQPVDERSLRVLDPAARLVEVEPLDAVDLRELGPSARPRRPLHLERVAHGPRRVEVPLDRPGPDDL